MLSLIVGLGLLGMLGSGEGRRLAGRAGTPEDLVRALLESRARATGLATVLGLVAGVEALAEVELLRPWWMPTVLAALLLMKVLGPAVWDEALRPGWEARGVGAGHVPQIEETLLDAGLGLALRYGVVAGGWLLLHHQPRFSVVVAVYVGYCLLSAVLAPALLRLMVPSRRPTGAERRLLRAAASRSRLSLGEVRLRTGAGGQQANAFVAGLWPTGSRICVTERLLAELDEESLGWVLAHEVAHRDRWHYAVRVGVGTVTGAAAAVTSLVLLRTLGASPGVGTTWAAVGGLVVVTWARRLLVRAFERAQEHEADADATARTSPEIARRALALLAERSVVADDRSRLGSTHPSFARRLARAGSADRMAPA